MILKLKINKNQHQTHQLNLNNILFLNKFIFIGEFVDAKVILVKKEKEIWRKIGKNEKIKRENEINKIGKYLE